MKCIVNAKEAARLSGISQEAIRYRMETGQYKFGRVYRPKGGKQRRYEISVQKLAEHCGYDEIPQEWKIHLEKRRTENEIGRIN